MVKIKIGLQLYSVRDAMKEDFKGTLQKVKKMGYEGVEFAGLFGNTPQAIKSMLDEIGLTSVSAHVPIDELLGNIAGVIADYKTIGCRFIAIPWLGESRRPGQPDYQQTLADIIAIGEEAKRQGITLLYHNHDFEFVKIGDKYALDLMYENIPSDLLQTQLDTCWVNVAGEDPVQYIRKYSGRAPVVHLKDFVMPGKKPDQLYELIGDSKRVDSLEAEKFEYRPNGYGVQNIPMILEAAYEAGAEWAIVEQDSPSMGKSSMECSRMSIEYLKTI
ncbi:MAG: sugar phosphate isomerase/epimerase [Oscillospiraceae bacterium]|nr:sugar phosphate isomerase/epimerase [Oscillospiraceae bacterium]